MGNNSCSWGKWGSVVLSEGERNKKVSMSCCECGGYRRYSEMSVSGGSVWDIGGSGGSRS